MYIVLVHYKEWEPACHPMLDDELIKKSEIVEVENLLDINKMFPRIEKIEILNNFSKKSHSSRSVGGMNCLTKI